MTDDQRAADHAAALAALLTARGFRRFTANRSPVGHLILSGRIDAHPVDLVLDTGAAKTFAELQYCRSAGISTTDTGQPGQSGTVHSIDGVRIYLDDLALVTDGLFAIDMTSTNERLQMRGVDPIRAVIGQDVLRHHRAVIDYATLSVFLHSTPPSQL